MVGALRASGSFGILFLRNYSSVSAGACSRTVCGNFFAREALTVVIMVISESEDCFFFYGRVGGDWRRLFE